MGEFKSFRLSHVVIAGTLGVLFAGGIFTGILLFFKPAGGGVPSPIKVRGGSMTVRASNLTANDGNNPETTYYNTGVAAFKINLLDVAEIPSTVAAPITLEDVVIVPSGASQSWVIDLWGHKTHTRDDKSTFGIKLCSNAQCDVTKPSTTVFVFPEPGSRFYPDMNFNDDNTKGLRFRDPQNAGGLFKTFKDVDILERISEIDITFPTGNLPTSPKPNSKNQPPTYVYLCPNGECFIGIGAP